MRRNGTVMKTDYVVIRRFVGFMTSRFFEVSVLGECKFTCTTTMYSVIHYWAFCSLVVRMQSRPKLKQWLLTLYKTHRTALSKPLLQAFCVRLSSVLILLIVCKISFFHIFLGVRSFFFFLVGIQLYIYTFPLFTIGWLKGLSERAKA